MQRPTPRRPLMKFDLSQFSTDLKVSAGKLLAKVAQAQSREQIEREGFIALGFVLGLETAKYLRPIDIEGLNLMFEEAVETRLKALEAGASDADRQ